MSQTASIQPVVAPPKPGPQFPGAAQPPVARPARRPVWRRIAGAVVSPILHKELRVSSRRRRNYVFRVVYVLALLLFVALVWSSVMRSVSYHERGLAQIQYMSRAGIEIITALAWFQFIVMQLVGVVLLSNSVSQELEKRTLGVLMCTPISGLQIVLGKLTSKLWQVVLLLAISLPPLAIVRVFGGVPWDFVVASACLTFTSTLVAGAMSLLFSVFIRRAFVVILLTLMVLGILYMLFPALFMMIIINGRMNPDQHLMIALGHLLPYIVLGGLSANLMGGSRMGFGVPVLWWATCLIQLGVATGFVALATALVRKVALRQAAGAPGRSFQTVRLPSVRPPVLVGVSPAAPFAAPPVNRVPPAGDQGQFTGCHPQAASPCPEPVEGVEGLPLGGAPAQTNNHPQAQRNPLEGGTHRLRTITGCPVLWHELRNGLLRSRLATGITWGVIVLLILLTYRILARNLDSSSVHAAYGVVFTVLGLLVTTVYSATTITSEKETGTWLLLMATPMSSGRIAWSKFVGTLRRVAFAWLLLFAHVALFTFFGLIHPVAFPMLLLAVVPVVIFLCGTGLWLSSLVRHTTTAVVLNLCVALALWAAVPFVVAMATRDSGAVGEVASVNPVYQVGELLDKLVDDGPRSTKLQDIEFDLPRHIRIGKAAVLLAVSGFAYALLGFVMVAAAAVRFRRHRRE